MLRVSDPDLIAHWPFRENLKDHSESGLSIQNHGVEIGESGGKKKRPIQRGGSLSGSSLRSVFRDRRFFMRRMDLYGRNRSGRRHPQPIRSGNPPGMADLGPHQYRQ